MLLLGKNGQVGWELQRSLAPLSELVALNDASTDYCGDLTNTDGLAQTVPDVAPDAIVNAAAYTAVDKAQTDTEQARGGNFAKTILRLAQGCDHSNVVNNQFGAPTGAELLADVTAHCILQAKREPEVSGLYHLAAGGTASWFDYGNYVVECARSARLDIEVAPDAIRPIPASAYPLPARRPHNSRMATDKLQDVFKLVLPDWHSGMQRMLTEISETQKGNS